MRKFLIFLLTLTCLLAGCKQVQTVYCPASPYVDATVSKVYGGSFDAVILDGHDSGLKPGDAVSYISLCGHEYKAGDQVRILFDGGVMETYPYQLGGVTDIVPLENEPK